MPKPLFTVIDFKSLSDRNLLAYYRKRRKEFFQYRAKVTCDCGCNELYWYIYDHLYEEERVKYNLFKQYILQIKNELDTRKHIEPSLAKQKKHAKSICSSRTASKR